jgi:hypothetical protein
MTRTVIGLAVVLWAVAASVFIAPRIRGWTVFPIAAAIGHMGADLTSRWWRK